MNKIAEKCPYLGLQPHAFSTSPNSSSRLFGRDDEINQIVNRLESGREFTVIAGSSASGKSSLVYGGIIPRLVSLDSWDIAVTTPLKDPSLRLRYAMREFLDVSSHKKSLVDGLRARNRKLLIVVDQFEELFDTVNSEKERFDFLVEVFDLLRLNQIAVLFVVRSEYLGVCQTVPKLAEKVTENLFLIPALDIGDYKEMVWGPFSQQFGEEIGRHNLNDFDTHVVRELYKFCSSLSGFRLADDRLPLMQLILVRAWKIWKLVYDSNGFAKDFPENCDEFAKAISQAIDECCEKPIVARLIDDAIESLNDKQRSLVEWIFRSCVKVHSDRSATRAPRKFEELSKLVDSELDLQATLCCLSKHGPLLVARHNETNRTIEISLTDPIEWNGLFFDVSHEFISRQWTSLKRWVDQERSGIFWLERCQALTKNALADWLPELVDVLSLIHLSSLCDRDSGIQLLPLIALPSEIKLLQGSHDVYQAFFIPECQQDETGKGARIQIPQLWPELCSKVGNQKVSFLDNFRLTATGLAVLEYLSKASLFGEIEIIRKSELSIQWLEKWLQKEKKANDSIDQRLSRAISVWPLVAGIITLTSDQLGMTQYRILSWMSLGHQVLSVDKRIELLYYFGNLFRGQRGRLRLQWNRLCPSLLTAASDLSSGKNGESNNELCWIGAWYICHATDIMSEFLIVSFAWRSKPEEILSNLPSVEEANFKAVFGLLNDSGKPHEVAISRIIIACEERNQDIRKYLNALVNKNHTEIDEFRSKIEEKISKRHEKNSLYHTAIAALILSGIDINIPVFFSMSAYEGVEELILLEFMQDQQYTNTESILTLRKSVWELAKLDAMNYLSSGKVIFSRFKQEEEVNLLWLFATIAATEPVVNLTEARIRSQTFLEAAIERIKVPIGCNDHIVLTLLSPLIAGTIASQDFFKHLSLEEPLFSKFYSRLRTQANQDIQLAVDGENMQVTGYAWNSSELQDTQERKRKRRAIDSVISNFTMLENPEFQLIPDIQCNTSEECEGKFYDVSMFGLIDNKTAVQNLSFFEHLWTTSFGLKVDSPDTNVAFVGMETDVVKYVAIENEISVFVNMRKTLYLDDFSNGDGDSVPWNDLLFPKFWLDRWASGNGKRQPFAIFLSKLSITNARSLLARLKNCEPWRSSFQQVCKNLEVETSLGVSAKLSEEKASLFSCLATKASEDKEVRKIWELLVSLLRKREVNPDVFLDNLVVHKDVLRGMNSSPADGDWNRLAKKKEVVGWDQTTGYARKWWDEFEKENSGRVRLIVKLVEEIHSRNATINDFFLAYVYSATDNIQANLHYMDYVRRRDNKSHGGSPDAITNVDVQEFDSWDSEFKNEATAEALAWWCAVCENSRADLQDAGKLLDNYLLKDVYPICKSSNTLDLRGNVSYLLYKELAGNNKTNRTVASAGT